MQQLLLAQQSMLLLLLLLLVAMDVWGDWKQCYVGANVNAGATMAVRIYAAVHTADAFSANSHLAAADDHAQHRSYCFQAPEPVLLLQPCSQSHS